MHSSLSENFSISQQPGGAPALRLDIVAAFGESTLEAGGTQVTSIVTIIAVVGKPVTNNPILFTHSFYSLM
jgi:hypothetical protein